MKPAPLTYRRARTTDEAFALVGECDGFAMFLAGGQTLGPMINLRLVQPDLLVDISRIEQLRDVVEQDGSLQVGAGVTHAALEDGVVPDVTNGLLRRVAAGIAYRAIRNRGTLGGSLAHADPSAEWLTVMIALGATLHCRMAAGRREIAADQLAIGAMATVLADDELIETVEIPRLSPSARWGFYKGCRKAGEFADFLSVVVLDRERGFHRAVAGAVGTAPRCLSQTSRMLADMHGWTDGRDAEIRAAFESDLEGLGLVLDAYDRHVHGLSVIRAAKAALLS